MGDYLRLLTVSDRDIPLADLQRAASSGAVWSVDHPGMLGNYLAIGPKIHENQNVWATVERNPVGPNTLGAEEVAEFIDSLEAGGPPVGRPLALRLSRERPGDLRDPDLSRRDGRGSRAPFQAVYAVRTALRQAVGGIGQWDGLGFTNEDDRLIWTDPSLGPSGCVPAAILDESTGRWHPLRTQPRRPRGARRRSSRGEVRRTAPPSARRGPGSELVGRPLGRGLLGHLLRPCVRRFLAGLGRRGRRLTRRDLVERVGRLLELAQDEHEEMQARPLDLEELVEQEIVVDEVVALVEDFLGQRLDQPIAATLEDLGRGSELIEARRRTWAVPASLVDRVGRSTGARDVRRPASIPQREASQAAIRASSQRRSPLRVARLR